jgi:hypothetical protein
MEGAGSWSGETHFQKTLFFLQDGLGVPIAYDYIMYKHGPCSFDLHDDLTMMRGNGLLEFVPRQGFGLELHATDSSSKIRGKFPKTLTRYRNQIRWAAREISRRGVGDLERIGTALFLTKHEWLSDPEEVADRQVELKPHVPRPSAVASVREVFQLLRSAPIATTP